MTPSNAGALDERLREFLLEDIGASDVTTEWTVATDAPARGALIARTACVVSGLPVARRVFELLDPALLWEGEAATGKQVAPGSTLALLSGRARAILTAERVALNLLQRMCGIATATSRFVDAVSGTGCRILDTRKTVPGLRVFDRQAVREGGGSNHRNRLSDMVLIKDNHRRLAGGVAAALDAVRRNAPAGMRIEVEVETEDELDQALGGGAEAILIDNQPPATVALWVRRAREKATPPWIEASGNMSLENAGQYARTGVDAISVGSLTHSVRAADISLEIDLP